MAHKETDDGLQRLLIQTQVLWPFSRAELTTLRHRHKSRSSITRFIYPSPLKMPISKDFTVPSSARQLEVPPEPYAKSFVIFISSEDPETKQPWCPDVRASWPHIVAAFEGQTSPLLNVVQVGQRPEWRDPDNVYRKNWNVNGVPTLAKFQRVNGEVVETARLDENGIMDVTALHEFLDQVRT